MKIEEVVVDSMVNLRPGYQSLYQNVAMQRPMRVLRKFSGWILVRCYNSMEYNISAMDVEPAENTSQNENTSQKKPGSSRVRVA